MIMPPKDLAEMVRVGEPAGARNRREFFVGAHQAPLGLAQADFGHKSRRRNAGGRAKVVREMRAAHLALRGQFFNADRKRHAVEHIRPRIVEQRVAQPRSVLVLVGVALIGQQQIELRLFQIVRIAKGVAADAFKQRHDASKKNAVRFDPQDPPALSHAAAHARDHVGMAQPEPEKVPALRLARQIVDVRRRDVRRERHARLDALLSLPFRIKAPAFERVLENNIGMLLVAAAPQTIPIIVARNGARFEPAEDIDIVPEARRRENAVGVRALDGLGEDWRNRRLLARALS